MSSIDKRKIQRLDLQLPAFLKFKEEQQDGTTEYRTKDVSSKGAFLYTDMPVSIGAGVNVELILPSHAHIKMDGFVVRSNQSGFAVQFTPNYKIIPVQR